VQKPSDDVTERLRELLDGTEQHAGRDRIAAHQNALEFLLPAVELFGRYVRQRIGVAEPIAPAIQNRLKALLVGLIPEKRAVVAQLDVIIVDADAAQFARAVGKSRGGQRIGSQDAPESKDESGAGRRRTTTANRARRFR